MTGVQTLEARLALGCAAGAAGILLSGLSVVHKPTRGSFRRLLCGIFLLSRVGVFALIFLVAKIAPRGDIPSFYLSDASAVLRGALPYRDFRSSYAPLHGYMDGTVLLIWHSPLALILFAILTELLLVWLWLRVGAELFPERELRVASVLYLTSAISLQFVAIDGQDNVVIALLILIALWLAMRSKVVLSGILTALGAVMVKLIPIFYAPVFFAGIKRRWAWALGFLALVLLGYGSFVALRAPVLQPLSVEGPLKSSGTVPFFLEAVTGLYLPVQFWDAIMLAILGATYVAVWRAAAAASVRSRVLSILWGIAIATMVLVTFANKSWPPYLMLILFPICLLVAANGVRGRIFFALFGVVALCEKSYWATLLDLEGAPELHRALLQGNRESLVFLLLEILLLFGYGWLLRGCVANLLSVNPDLPVSRPARAS